MQGKNTHQQAKGNTENRFVTSKFDVFIFFFFFFFLCINAIQASPIYSRGNDFVISEKYIENEISGSTKCAQTWQDI